MTTTGQQPEALVFANDRPTSIGDDLYQWALDAEALIRTQHASIAELAAAPQAVEAAVPEAIEQMAVDRYKVVPSHESMFHRWAVVADNGAQQLYIGREGECQNMARKFMGAFLDGAFVAMQNAAPAHPAEGVPAQAVAVPDARAARQITDAIVENFKDAGWSMPSIDEARVLEAVSAAIVEHGASEPLTGVASDVDSMARVLMAAFAKAEPEHPITRYPTSFVATFADMARAAIAAAQLADGVPAQSYVVDFFKAKGFYPSPAQAFAAGVALAATQPAAQGMEQDAKRYRWLRECNSGSLVVVEITGTGDEDWHVLTEADADAAIDAALAAQAKQGDQP